MGCVPPQQKPASASPSSSAQLAPASPWDPADVGAKSARRGGTESTTNPPPQESLHFSQRGAFEFQQGQGRPEKSWINAANMSSRADLELKYENTAEFEEEVSSVLNQAAPQQNASGLSGMHSFLEAVSQEQK